MTIIISSQRFVDDKIVNEKIENKDYEVFISPEFVYDGKKLAVVLDGHHSLAAAELEDATPTFIEFSASEDDRIGVLEDGDIKTFLELCWIDAEYYDVKTKKNIW